MTQKQQYHYKLTCGHRRATYKLLTEKVPGRMGNLDSLEIKQIPLYCMECDDWFMPKSVEPTIGRFST